MSYLLISDCLHRNHLCWLCRIMDGSESTQVYSFWWRTRYSEQTPKHFQLYPCSVLSQYVIHSANGARGTPSMLRTSILVGEGGQCASERWTGLQLLISALDSAPDSATDFSSQESKRGSVVESGVGPGASTIGIGSGKAWLTWPRSTEAGGGIPETEDYNVATGWSKGEYIRDGEGGWSQGQGCEEEFGF